ncbi:hypothetical protein C0J52_01011 [Blattella germanica]|nr:hypothetical protein C0J52_01011 [Blattella germanica]
MERARLGLDLAKAAETHFRSFIYFQSNILSHVVDFIKEPCKIIVSMQYVPGTNPKSVIGHKIVKN